MKSNKESRQYAEDVAIHFENAGLSRTAGRIFGWLLIADPPHQTMNDLVEDLQVSKSTVSTATRTLMQLNLVHRISLPGIRRDYYRIAEGVWQNTMQQQYEQITAFRKLAERGLGLLEPFSNERKARLGEMLDFYVFLEKEFPKILERWQQQRFNKAEGAFHE